jgi:WD40 repeat protein
MGAPARARDDLSAYRRALVREGHVLVEEPDLMWQQLHNRLQWEDRPGVSAKLQVERERRSGGRPWLWRRTRTDESAAWLRMIPTAGMTYLPGTCSFSEDGSLIATTGRAGVVRLWETATGSLRTEIGSGQTWLCCALSPDGSLVAAGHSGEVTVWTVADGAVLRRLTPSLSRQVMRQIDAERHAAALAGEISSWESGRYDNVLAVAFGASGTLAAATANGRVSLFDISTGDELAVLDHAPAPVAACAFHPRGDVLATVAGDGVVRLWQLPHRRRSRPVEVPLAAAGRPTKAAFSPDGARLAVVCSREIVIVDPATADQVTAVPSATGALACTFSPDGALLAVAGDEVQLRDAVTGELVSSLRGPAPTPHDCAFSPDGRLLATAGFDVVALWDVSSAIAERETSVAPAEPQPWAEEPVATDRLRSPDGTLEAENLLTAVRVCDGATGEEQYRVAHPPMTRAGVSDSSWQNELVLAPVIGSAFFSPDGRVLYTVGEDDRIFLWAAEDGHQLHDLYCRGLRGTATSPDGSTLATGDTAGELRLWDVATGETRLTVTDAGLPGAFSPDSRVVVTTRALEVCLWDVATGVLVAHLPVSQPVARPRFHPSRPALRCDIVEDIGGRTVGTLDIELVGLTSAR